MLLGPTDWQFHAHLAPVGGGRKGKEEAHEIDCLGKGETASRMDCVAVEKGQQKAAKTDLPLSAALVPDLSCSSLFVRTVTLVTPQWGVASWGPFMYWFAVPAGRSH